MSDWEDAPATGHFTTANGDTPESIMAAIQKLEPNGGPATQAFQEQARRTPTFSTTGFDPAPKEGGGWEDAPVKKRPMLDLKDQADTAVATGDEAVRFGLSGLLSGVSAGVPAALKTLNDKVNGRDSSFEQNYADASAGMTYTPKTEGGIEAAQRISEFGNRNLNPLLGHMGGFSAEQYSSRKGGEPSLPKEKAPVTAADKVAAAQAEIDRAKALKEESLWESAPDRDPADPFGQMKQQLDVPQKLEAEPNPVMDSMAKGLQDQPMTAEQMNKGAEADKLATDRQTQTDLDVKRQATLDYNAAERARQENAGIPPVPDPASLEANVPPEHKMMYDDLLAETRKDDPTSGTPAFMQPDSNYPNPSFNTRTRRQGGGVLLDGETKTPEPIQTRESSESFLKRVLQEDAKSHVGRLGAPVWTAPKAQRGAINPAVFVEGFQKLKQLADGVWLRAFSDGNVLRIEAHKDGRIIADTALHSARPKVGTYDRFAESVPLNLEAYTIKVKPEFRRQGIASELYKFAAELGNDVQPSMGRTPEGKAMWKGFEDKGVSQGSIIRSPGNKQMGAIRLGERKQQVLDKILPTDKNMIPKDPDATAAVAEALTEGKDNSQWNYTESGSTLAYMKRASVAVMTASRYIQNALKRADLHIRDNVFPVEKAFRSLTRTEIASLADVMKMEMLKGKRFDHEAIAALTVKQQEAYAHMRAMFEDTLRIQNEARKAKNQEPITELEAYMSSRWKGDFRRPLYQAVLNKDGSPKINDDGSIARKLVWYLAADTKRGLEAQTKALLKDHPDLSYTAKDDHTVRYYKRQTDLQSAYNTVLDIIGRDDPAVQRLKQAVEDQATNEAASFLGQEKHFKEKTGVRGFVGDRPGYDGVGEALDFFQQQIQYAKNAYKWSELQQAGQGIKTLVSDPRLNEQQPNNVKYIKEYYKNSIGYGEAAAISHLEDSIRNLGVSPTVFDSAVGGAKSYFILTKLFASTGFFLANMVQTTMILPHLVDQFAKGHHGNPLTAVGVGIPGGLAMATGHYLNFLLGDGKRPTMPTKEQSFYMDAYRYAEDNGITARSIMDESPINTSFSVSGKLGKAMGSTLVAPEVMVRSMAYMTAVEFLRSGGKFGNYRSALFQKAEEMVNASMVDYRAQERPMMFAKTGAIGNMLNTLQTYPMNWYNQWNYMGREAMKGNVGPVMAMAATQYAVAGAMGIPGFDDLNKLWGVIRDHMPAVTYSKVMENEFMANPKLWMIKNLGQASVYGVLSDKSGLGISSRVTAPTGSEMLQAPGAPVLDTAKQIYHVADAAIHPTDTTKRAQAGMSVVPPGVAGALETAPFMEGKTFEKVNVDGQDRRLYQRNGDISDHKGTYLRTPEEDTLRKWTGLRSQKEVVSRDVGYQEAQNTQTAQKQANSIPNAFYDAAKRGDVSRARELYIAHIKLTGTPVDGAAIEKQIMDNYTSTSSQTASAARSVQALQNVARTRAILEQLQKEYAK